MKKKKLLCWCGGLLLFALNYANDRARQSIMVIFVWHGSRWRVASFFAGNCILRERAERESYLHYMLHFS